MKNVSVTSKFVHDVLGALSTLALELDTSVKKIPSNAGIHELGGDESGRRTATAHRSAIELADKVRPCTN